VGEALQIHQALSARGVPVELVIFADEGHGAQKRENQVLMLGRTIEFFRKHLASPAAAR
jgi:dipeptidyl aminopeptidase/acylaminoacyl peptidase